jgi:hypothetical protein
MKDDGEAIRMMMQIGALLRLNMRDLANEPMRLQVMHQIRTQTERDGLVRRYHWFPMNPCRRNCAGCWSGSTPLTAKTMARLRAVGGPLCRSVRGAQRLQAWVRLPGDSWPRSGATLAVLNAMPPQRSKSGIFNSLWSD